MTMRPTSASEADASTAEKTGGRPTATGLPPVAGSFRQDIIERTQAFVVRPETAALLLIPVAIYFWFVHQFGVNAIWYDQWANVALLTHSNFFSQSNAGHLNLSMLWAQHNENRMLFPNLMVLALGSLTHLNVLTEQYLSALLLVVAVSLIILASRRDLAPVHWIIYLPVAFLMLTLGQFGDTLFGFQLAWYVILVALAAVVFLLDSPRANWVVLVAAIGIAVIGSYSSLQGLFIWPAGLIVLLWRHRPRALVITWLLSAVVTIALYFYHFDFSATASGQGHYPLANPFSVLEFFFSTIGDVMGKPLPSGPRASDPVIVFLGVTIFVLAVTSLIVYARRSRLAKSPVGPALICFGLLFAASVTLGRSSSGLAVASQSRYVTFNLLILVGCYLCLIERWPGPSDDGTIVADLDRKALPVVDAFDPAVRTRRRTRAWVALRVLAIVIIAWMIWAGAENGIAGGGGSQLLMQRAALVSAHAEDAPNSLIEAALFPNVYASDVNIRGLAEQAKKDHLSLFATSEGARLERLSLPKSGRTVPLLTSVVTPKSGAVLRGSVFLLATATGDYPIRAVDFRISGSTTGPAIDIHGAHFAYGYLGAWSSTGLPNGTYSLQSVVHDVGGHMSTSKPVPVTVHN